MDLYNSFMDIDDVIEYLNTKTDRKFNADKFIKFIEDKNIPIVFKYIGFLIWRFEYEGKYQSLSMKMDGYFSFRNSSEAIEVFKGCSNEMSLDEAIIYHLDSPDIRGNAPKGIKPKKGDIVLFKTGGRPPALTPDLTLRMKPEMNYPIIENPIKIYNSKVGVLREGEGKVGILKVNLEEYLNNKRTETMENEIKMETSSSKIEKLESENEKLKSENSSLTQQLEELAIANSLIKQKEQDINELKEKLRLHLEEPPKDKQLTYKSQMTVARILYAILTEHNYDLSATKGKTNQLIEKLSQSHGTSVTRNFIAQWIDLANQAKNDSVK